MPVKSESIETQRLKLDGELIVGGNQKGWGVEKNIGQTFSEGLLTFWQLSIKYLLGGNQSRQGDTCTCVSDTLPVNVKLLVSPWFVLTSHLPVQVSVCWRAAQCSYPALPCWSQAVYWSVLLTCQTLAPTPAWQATPVALTRPLPTCWCGVSEITGNYIQFSTVVGGSHFSLLYPTIACKEC